MILYVFYLKENKMTIVSETNLGLSLSWFTKLSEFHTIFSSVSYGNVIEKLVNNLFFINFINNTKQSRKKLNPNQLHICKQTYSEKYTHIV